MSEEAELGPNHPSLWDLTVDRAVRSPRELILSDEGGRTLTFGTFRVAADEAASGLVDLGVSAGSTVAWVMPTWIETFVLMAALSRLDCVQVPLLPQYGALEIGYAIRATHADVVVAVSEFRGRRVADGVRDVSRDLPGLRLVELPDRQLPTGSPMTDAAPTRGGTDPVRWIVFTSGTTSAPKGVLHTDGTLLAAARALAHSSGLGPGDVGSVAFPVAHVGGPAALFMSLETGAPNVVVERFEARRAVEIFRSGGVTLLGAGPGFQPAYLELVEGSGEAPLFPSLRAVLSGGAPKIPAVHEALRAGTGVEILSSYGMTEFPTATGHVVDDPPDKLLWTEGRANPGVEVQIRNGGGMPVGTDVQGEIWLRGPQRCRGYLDAAATEAAIDEQGFFRTGDLGSLDADGYLSVTGRLKDIIIRKGENISVIELEELLGRDPSVQQVAVVGLPDPEVGELCCAVVVPAPGAVVSLGDLTDRLLAAGLMRQKLPERLEIVESLPRNATGKVLRHALREKLVNSAG